MSELRRIRRAGGDALRLLVDLLPNEWDPRSGDEDVTVVFADVEGYSAFVAEAGDDAAMAVLRVLDHVVDSSTTGRKGVRVVKRLGDGVMIVARQPDDGLLVASALVRTFGADVRELGWPLRLRSGVHRGTCRRQGDDYFGYHVNLAARVTESADGGEVRVTPNALAGVNLVELGMSAQRSGQLHAKGVTTAVELFRLTERPDDADRRSLRRPAS